MSTTMQAKFHEVNLQGCASERVPAFVMLRCGPCQITFTVAQVSELIAALKVEALSAQQKERECVVGAS